MSSAAAEQRGVVPRADESELLNILDALPGMVVFWNADGRCRYANKRYLDWFDRSAEETQGAHLADVLGPELYELTKPYVEAVLGGEAQTFERRLRDHTGITRHHRAQYIPYVEDEEVTGFFALISDISGMVRTEKALQEQARQVALLEERQRIAADLHDLVIQRLFAAGLDLAAVQRGADDADARVMSAAVGVDDAIRELRKSIHSLRELMNPVELPSVVERILENATRMLGFDPVVSYIGSLEEVSPEVVQDLLAVLNEALSNVARHAAASSVHVTRAVTDGHVVLQVADDGRGTGQSTRSSGLRNMRERAERNHGTFVCRGHHPRGTAIEWTVPARPLHRR